MFDLDIIIDFFKNCDYFKKSISDNFFFFRILFLSKKLAKVDLLNNSLLL